MDKYALILLEEWGGYVKDASLAAPQLFFSETNLFIS
jgi:hypothetical protein